MNKIIQLGLAAAFVIGGAGAALSEDAAAGVAGAVINSTNAATSTSVDAMQTGSIGTNFGSLVTNIDAGASANVDLSAFTEASTVNFVKVSSFSDMDESSLDAALGTKTEAIASLQSSISANAALNAKLEAAGYAPEDVLAVETDANGALTVYIDDRA